MMRHTSFSRMLMFLFSLTLLNAGMIDAVYASQSSKEKVQESDPRITFGKVTEVIDVAGYTYAEVDTGKQRVWVAGPPTEMKNGDTIGFSPQMPMQNFHSKSLGRDFPVIYFISAYITDKQSTGTASPHENIRQQDIKPVVGIVKLKGGNTIAEIYADRTKLEGNTIRVRGKVTRFTADIMEKNWLHIRDSSTLDDLTVTSDGTAEVGDVVIVEGRLELDKDFNYGYVYPVILEQARITKE